MVNLIAILVIYSIFFMGCSSKVLVKNCEHIRDDVYECEGL